MELASAWSVALYGVDGIPVEIEADIGGTSPRVQLVGLADTALHEAKERVRAAVRNSGEKWPDRRVTFALSPASLPKVGSGYDLALACVVLAALHAIPQDPLRKLVLLGELALDGRLRTVRGVLPSLLAARRAGLCRAIVPISALAEAALVDGVDVRGAEKLTDVLAWLRGDPSRLITAEPVIPSAPPAAPDLADVLGQPEARWALEVAAAGGHHVLFTGPPGTGKSMLAQRLVGLLPSLSTEEALEVTGIHSIAGSLSSDSPLITSPPFVAPHHTTSLPALVGGGVGLAKPGAVSCAHRGVLFIDEAPEFKQQLLDSLRTPLEEGEVRIARRDGIARYPARFQLVLAANPCSCAPPKEIDCICSSLARRRYLSKLSGPLLDRVDLQVRMRPLTAMSLAEADITESTSVVRQRVLQAREAAHERWKSHGWRTNAEVPGPMLRRQFALPAKTFAVLERGLHTGAITARGADRCLRVAWTLADLAGNPTPQAEHLAAALQFRDRRAS